MFNLMLILVCASLLAPEDDPKPAPKKTGAVEENFQHPKGIAWIGTWEAAKTEAQRTGKPILLLSAAPQHLGVPGVW